jgi:hypothetical protein
MYTNQLTAHPAEVGGQLITSVGTVLRSWQWGHELMWFQRKSSSASQGYSSPLPSAETLMCPDRRLDLAPGRCH